MTIATAPDTPRAIARDYAALMARAAAILADQDRALAAARVEAETQARMIQHLRAESARLEREVVDLRRRLTAVDRLRPAQHRLVADALRGARFNGGGE